MDKSQEASSEKSAALSQDAAPAYDNPPTYDSLSSAVHTEMSALATGDPTETISVPMVSRMHHKSIHDMNPFSHKTGRVTQTVTVRKMTREFYLKHYVKDAKGNFVGTGRQAPDGGLVFVPGKSTPEDLMKQVQQVAFARQNIRGEGIGAASPQVLGGAGGAMIGGSMGAGLGF